MAYFLNESPSSTLCVSFVPVRYSYCQPNLLKDGGLIFLYKKKQNVYDSSSSSET